MCEELLLINSQLILERQQSLLWGKLLFESLGLGTGCSGVRDGRAEGVQRVMGKFLGGATP